MNSQLILSITLLLLSVINLNAQELTAEQLGFKAYSIEDETLGEINYYISSNKIDSTKPVLLYLDGSGAYPLFQYTEGGIGSTVIIDFRALSNDFHVVLISKPGVPFIDSVKSDMELGMPIYKTPKKYIEKLSLDWRVNSADLVLSKVMDEVKVEKKKIAVIGISEGFQVGAKLATLNNSITHLALLVGNGLNQFYDFIIQNRIDAQQGVISNEDAQKNIDSLMLIAQDIYANPTLTDKEWYGHTYLRWSSFTSNNPSEHILNLTIPVYIVAASNDRNTSVLGTDYLFLESIRQGKSNLEYKVYPFDHSFNEEIKDENGKTVAVKNHMWEVIGDAIDWIIKK